MKLFNYALPDYAEVRLGLAIGGQLYDAMKLAAGRQAVPFSVDDALRDWPASFEELENLQKRPNTDALLEESEIHFLPPLLRPANFRDFYAFERHVKTARALRNLDVVAEWYEIPVFYFSNPHALYGHKAFIQKPAATSELDFELEVGCIIGRRGRNIKAENATGYIAGYCVLNDWSARDLQRREMRVGLGPAKGKDFATGLGPFLVTADELKGKEKDKGYDLRMTARKNGQLISDGNWSEIHYSFGEMIARASQDADLHAGDLLGSGTVGSGCILELRPENTNGWLEPGDTITLEIEGLGVLEQKVSR